MDHKPAPTVIRLEEHREVDELARLRSRVCDLEMELSATKRTLIEAVERMGHVEREVLAERADLRRLIKRVQTIAGRATSAADRVEEHATKIAVALRAHRAGS